jgi:hypothetical protein
VLDAELLARFHGAGAEPAQGGFELSHDFGRTVHRRQHVSARDIEVVFELHGHRHASHRLLEWSVEGAK